MQEVSQIQDYFSSTPINDIDPKEYKCIDNEGDYTVYCTNIAFTVTIDELKDLFSPFGTIVSILPYKPQGVFTGVAFVKYEKRESANKAISSLNDKEFKSNKLVLRFVRQKSRSRPRYDYDQYDRRYDDRRDPRLDRYNDRYDNRYRYPRYSDYPPYPPMRREEYPHGHYEDYPPPPVGRYEYPPMPPPPMYRDYDPHYAPPPLPPRIPPGYDDRYPYDRLY